MADANALWLQGQAAIRARRLDEARAHFEQLLRLQPAHVPARLLLASVQLASGSLRAAVRETLTAAQTLPNDAGTIARVAQALAALGEVNAARVVLAHPAIAVSRDAPALATLAQVHQQLNQQEQALLLFEAALALGLDNADIRYLLALQLQFNGRLARAQDELRRCLRIGPTYGRASLTLARLRKATQADNQLDLIAHRLTQVEPGSEDEAAFEFGRYTELEALGRYDEAWAALERGNAVMHARLRERAGLDEDGLLRAIEAKATADFLETVRDEQPPASAQHPQPIFIIGMPRSGTTLLESILGRHSQIAAAGELNDFSKQWRFVADVHGHALVDEKLLAAATDYSELGRRYLEQTRWRARGKAWYVDKLPPNFWLAGFMHKALPQARILQMVRDPLEICFSNWRAMFGDSYAYSYDQSALAAHHARYRRLMEHWHAAMPGAIYDVDYAALVESPNEAVRAVLEHMGLEFEAGVLQAGDSDSPVATLSSTQVRSPISDRARYDWRNYAQQLSSLARRLGS